MDRSSPVGTWYLLANKNYRLELSINSQGVNYSGTIKDEGGPSQLVEQISWDPNSRWLEFRRDGVGFFQWYRICLAYGVMAGRFSHEAAPTKPACTAYAYHVTGWSPDWIDSDILPRTWNLTINTTFKGVLRIDRDSENVLRGRLKVFDNTAVSGVQEELENDLTSITWDGTNLSFTRSAGFTQVYSGIAKGRFIQGTFTHNGGPPTPWGGARGEVIGFGLGLRLSARAEWQAATRARVVNLTEGMRLAGFEIPPVTVQNEGSAGLFINGYPAERDDDFTAWPANYTIQKLRFSVPPGSRFDPANPPPARIFEGYLAIPQGPVPPEGFRALVAVNGHGGDAQQVLASNSGDIYWYGESAARRNLMVLAIDIGHRPKWNMGPIVHPPIIDAGYADSNWEEDGERCFSVRRAIDWLLDRPNVRKDRLFMAGLSMGGEVSTITCALDPRIHMGIIAGFSPDMYVMDLNGNHRCYLWDHADIHEYLDVSDWEALVAPRPLVVETGKADFTFSPSHPPYAADKQVTRRAREAYGPSAANLIHYLHYDQHQFHIGGLNPTNPGRPQGVLAAVVTNPVALGDQSWQTDSSTALRSPSVYDLMNEFLP